MTVKNLVKHGNSVALIIDKALLQAANLDEKAIFQIVCDSNAGMTIQSVKPSNEDAFDDAMEKVLKKHKSLFKRLSQR